MEKIPSIKFTSVGSNRLFDLSNPDTTTLLVFHGQDNARIVKTVNEKVRLKYKKNSQVTVASVIDLGWVPRLFRKMAQKKMLTEYQQAAARLPAEFPAEEYLILLPDWEGELTEFLEFKDTGGYAAIAVLDTDGKVLCKAQINGDITGEDQLVDVALLALNKHVP